MAGAREGRLGAVGGEQLGAELGEVDLLRVGGALGVFAQHHGAREVLDRFFDHVREDPHQRRGLLFREALVPEPLDELERVEVVVAEEGSRAVEEAPVRDEAEDGRGGAAGGGVGRSGARVEEGAGDGEDVRGGEGGGGRTAGRGAEGQCLGRDRTLRGMVVGVGLRRGGW